SMTFFFSSRRRHTRCYRDWSSDVCSSDLDVTVTLPVAPWEAALGAGVTVPTLGGPVEMHIPPGAQSGQKLRLRGRGLPGQPPGRSEERRVGKECRARWQTAHEVGKEHATT